MTKLTGMIIGCGAIAREHLAAVSRLDDVEILAVCDLSPARAESTADRFKVAKWYLNYEEALTAVRPDLVHITTPPAAHFPIAKFCLERGLNVLCEKPITVEYEEFKSLRQLAAEKQCVLLENQNFRFHSSIKRIQALIASGDLGEIVDVQICISLDIVSPGSGYADRNAPHFGLGLKGGIIGDFLPHIAYLAQMFVGTALSVRTTWMKCTADTPHLADEFRGLIKGERATAYVSFSGNTQPNGFWLRINGTRSQAEANLFETPRLIVRKLRSSERAVSTAIDGFAETRDVFRGAVAGFFRKLSGVTSYDGLPEFIARTYRSLKDREAPPISLEEVEATCRLVDSFTNAEFKL